MITPAARYVIFRDLKPLMEVAGELLEAPHVRYASLYTEAGIEKFFEEHKEQVKKEDCTLGEVTEWETIKVPVWCKESSKGLK